jgi:hypothetical protein
MFRNVTLYPQDQFMEILRQSGQHVEVASQGLSETQTNG